MSGRREWAALAALVLLSTAFRAWAALEVPVPWIAPDEMVYGLIGRNLWLHGSMTILGGPTPYYSLLTPLLAGFPLAAFGLDTGLDVLHGLQPFVMSLAAVPTYLWARRLVSHRAAFAAAALALATPALVYSGLVMTEVLFYPLLVLAAWVGAETIAEPTRRNQGMLLVAFVAVCATRIQAIVIVPALVTAAVLDAGIARSWASMRRYVPTAVGFAVLILAWAVWRLVSGKGALGGYDVVASTSYSVGEAAKFVLYHGASLTILCGLFPVTAVALMLVDALRRGQGDARVRAYLAVASSLCVWLVVEVGVFASRYSDRIVERNLIGLAPVLFVGLVLWLERGPDSSYAMRAAVVAAAAVVLVVLPVRRYVNVYGMHDAMTLIPLFRLSTEASVDTMVWVYRGVAVAAAVLVLVPRRRLGWLPVALLVALVAGSVVSSRYVVDQARVQQSTFLGDDPAWADHDGGKRVAYLYDGEPSWPGVWETLFFNTTIDRVYDLGATTVPGPLPQTPVHVRPDGTIDGLPPDRKNAKYAIAANWIELAGKQKGGVAQQGLTQKGLVLWKLDQPLRLRSEIAGLQLNGDIAGQAVLVVYKCRSGTFRTTLLIKQPEVVDIRVDNKLVRHLEFSHPAENQPWHGDFAVTGRNGGVCSFSVTSPGLVGTTQFEFDRG